MPDVTAFFDRFDGMKPKPADHDPSSDESMQKAHDEMLPIYQRIAERAGLELTDLHQETDERMQAIPLIVVRRAIMTGEDLAGIIRHALVNIAVESFLAGALWEQDRHLPEIELPPDLEPGGGS